MARTTFKIVEGNDNEVELAIRNPQSEDIQEANQVYMSKVASMIKGSGTKKLLMRSELEKFLRDQGVWTKDDEQKVRDYQGEINKLLGNLRKGGIKLSEVRALCIKVMEKRGEMVNVLTKRQVFDDATIEAVAENDRTDYLIYICTVYADSGKNYWDSFEDMKHDKISDAYRKASVSGMKAIFDIDPEFEKNLPENKLLKKYGFVDENLNYVDRKSVEKVDRDGRPVKELEEVAQKQRDNLQGDIEPEVPFVDDEIEVEEVLAV